MPKCIFCLTTDDKLFNTVEHILPESIGGGDWAILPDGLYCDSCQNKFGSTIEQQALSDYPFQYLRTFLSIPTKKRKAPWMENFHGKFYAGGRPGLIGIVPSLEFENSIDKITATIFLAVSKKPSMVLRTLLKIGLEVIATDQTNAVFESRYDAARKFALTGEKESPWFYLQYEDYSAMQKYQTGYTRENDRLMYIAYFDNGCVTLNMRLFYLEFVVPLIEDVRMPEDFKPNEPTERLIIV